MKDKDKPVYNDRKQSFSPQSLFSRQGWMHCNPEQLAKAGYFLQDDRIRCCACDYSVYLDKADDLLSESVSDPLAAINWPPSIVQVIKPVPYCSIIATHPETQIIPASDYLFSSLAKILQSTLGEQIFPACVQNLQESMDQGT